MCNGLKRPKLNHPRTTSYDTSVMINKSHCTNLVLPVGVEVMCFSFIVMNIHDAQAIYFEIFASGDNFPRLNKTVSIAGDKGHTVTGDINSNNVVARNRGLSNFFKGAIL